MRSWLTFETGATYNHGVPLEPPIPTRDPVPADVARLVARYRTRLRVLASLRGTAWTVAVTSIALFAALLADRHSFLEVGERLFLTAVTVSIASASAVLLVLAALVRSTSASRLAAEIERANPELEGSLISTVELSSGDGERCSRDLLASLRDHTSAASRTIDIRRLAPAKRLWISMTLAVLCVLPLAGYGILHTDAFGQLVARFVHPREDLPRPSRVALRVEIPRAAVARGDDVEIRVTVERGLVVGFELDVRDAEDAPAGEWTRTRVLRDVDHQGPSSVRELMHLLPNVTRDLDVRVDAGDYRSPVFRITTADPPRPTSFEITYRYPQYAGRDDEISRKTRGDLVALAGSKATIRVESDRPMRSGRVHHVNGRVYESVLADDSTITFDELPIEKNGEYAVDIVDAAGVRNTGRLRYNVRALVDALPSIAILSPRSKEIEVEAAGVVEIRYRGEDDVGVARIELLIGEGDDAQSRTFREVPDPRSRRRIDVGTHRLSVDSLGLTPGQTVSVSLRATDGQAQSAMSTSRRLRIAYPPDAPEGRDWLARLDALRRGLRELTRAWEPAVVVDANAGSIEKSDGPAERVLGMRLFAARLAETTRRLAHGLSAPNPDRPALDALAFALGDFADGDAAAFWSVVVSAITRSPPDDKTGAALTRAHSRGRKSLERISGSLDTLVALQELEASHEVTRLLAHDARTLVATLRDAKTDDAGTTRERIAALSAETVHTAARLSRLADGPDAMPPARATELGRLARSLLSSVGQDLASASRSFETDQTTTTVEALEHAISAAESRRLDVLDAWTRTGIAARRARSSLWPQDSVAKEIEAIASTFEESDRGEATSLPRLESARRAFAHLDFHLGQTQSYEYSDFESASLLGAVREILEQTLEDDLEDRSLAVEPRAARRRERATVLRELAEAYRGIHAVLEIGRVVRTAHWIATGEEAIAWRLRTTREFHVRRVGFLRRSQTDLVESVQLLVSQPLFLPDRADGVDTPRGRAKTLAADAMQAAVDCRNDLTTESPDLPAASLSAQRAAVGFGDVTESLEEARSLALAEAQHAREWLAARRGSIVQRLLRLATGWRDHASRLRTIATQTAPSGEDIGALTSRSLLEHDESVREAREVGADMRREADRLVAAGARSAEIQAVDRAAGRVLGVVSTDLSRTSKDLRATLTTDREDRVLLFSSAAESLDTAAEKTVAIADALAVLGETDLAALEGADIDALLRDARAAAAESAPDAEAVALRARALLAASSKALRTLGERLPESIEKRNLVDHLATAAESFRLAVERAERGDARGGSDALRTGLGRLEAAVALVKKMRGDAEKALAPRPREDGVAQASKDTTDSELDAARKELEKLLETHAAQKEADALLDDLLREKSADLDPEKQRQAVDAADEVAKAIEEQAMTERRLLEIINQLLATEKDGQEIAEEERYVEEETRKVLAAAADSEAMERSRTELAPKQASLVDRATRIVDGFHPTGFKLSILLPDVFHAFRRAAASTQPMIESMRDARDALGESRPEESVEALTAANTRLGTFLAHVDATRRRALEAIARAKQRDGGDPGGAMQRALRDAKEAARMIASGQLREAKRSSRATQQNLLAAGRAIRKRLEEISLPSGAEGALLSRLLEEEAARHGLVWTVETRGEKFESDNDSEDATADMPFPTAYRALVRAYLRAIAR